MRATSALESNRKVIEKVLTSTSAGSHLSCKESYLPQPAELGLVVKRNGFPLPMLQPQVNGDNPRSNRS